MTPTTTKALAHARPAFPGARPSPFPLRDSEGRTWAERKAMREAKA